ncbi:GIY-YIG nuclease family protein [Sphingomonas sp. MS122]|uniref:GIY-YIG nuclease family protein n=1 Tax=Sphingomonas sp. MS122 TaxID=3412683 RepID=UPI003C2C29E1
MAMFYVYILQSENEPDQFYTGLADDLRVRLAEHNAGQSAHTSKYRPWMLVNYTAFRNRAKAVAFERYLKSGSGRAFALRHLR